MHLQYNFNVTKCNWVWQSVLCVLFIEIYKNYFSFGLPTCLQWCQWFRRWGFRFLHLCNNVETIFIIVSSSAGSGDIIVACQPWLQPKHDNLTGLICVLRWDQQSNKPRQAVSHVYQAMDPVHHTGFWDDFIEGLWDLGCRSKYTW